MPQPSPSTDVKASSIHNLSREEVAQLLDTEQATEARLNITAKLAKHYDVAGMKEEDEAIAEQIFRLLVRDTEIEIRKKLSDNLKTSNQLPRDIAMTIANDVTEVALPMLEYSKVLTDTDLADLIEATPDAQKHIAIAKRENVSEMLVEALLEHTDEVEVAQTLVGNNGAQLNHKSVETLVERHKRLPQVMEMLATRPSLPPSVKEKVISHVSEQLKKEMSKHHDAVKEVVQKEATQSREEATLELINNDLKEEDMRKLIDQLISFDRLTSTLLFASMVHGYINFYVVAMSVLGKVPLDNTVKLMRDRGGLGFRGLYNKCGLPAEHYANSRDLTPVALALKDEMSGLEGGGFARLLINRIEAEFKALEKPCDQLVAAIRDAIE